MRLMLPLTALFLVSFVTSTIKTTTFEGKIVYSISYEDLPAEYEAYVSMMPKEMTMYVSNDKARIEQNSGMGTTTTIVDKAKKEVVILMDMMGNKTAYKGSTEDDAKSAVKPTIKYSTETKVIAGYTCKRADMTYTEDGQEITNTVWYTEDLPSGLSRGVDGIDGFPMEYTIKANGMTMAMAVTAISAEKVLASYFSIPDGYAVKSMDDLKKMGGGK